MLMRGPSHGLDGCCVIAEFEHWLRELRVPDQKLIIIATRAKLLFVEGPFESTYFLLVTDGLVEEGLAYSDVSVQDHLIPGTRAEDGRVPGDGAHPVGVAVHDSDSFHLVDVPDLDFPAVGSHGKVSVLQRPCDRSHRIRDAQIAQLGNFGVVRIPQVHARRESHCQAVLG